MRNKGQPLLHQTDEFVLPQNDLLTIDVEGLGTHEIEKLKTHLRHVMSLLGHDNNEIQWLAGMWVKRSYWEGHYK